MFDGLVERYDLLNRLMTFGLDGRWRRQAISALELTPGDRILDLGCGTGDLLELLADARARPTGIDVSAAMLGRAQQRLSGRALLARGSAFELPFAAGSFQGAVSGFVLRNLRDLEGAMAELARVIAPGGRIALLDATEPAGWVRPLFDAWFRVATPALGALAGKRAAYQYLSRSLVQIPPAREMCRLLGAAGFREPAARPLTFGAVTLFTGRRA
ncbi:MAG TPA: ubiquinone/menaquinone biosynthesis methyltransferase [Chloroflexota bacterium]|nr:ubiquinone/menaquinone biosynthesis methyltransferase [Chloroflexota bacterium]